MKNLLMLALLTLPLVATATSLIFEPGQPMKAIEQTANGYIIMDMGGKGNTVVQNVGNLEFIHSGNAPSTVILHDPGEPVPTPYNLIDLAGEE
jgi:hypothetical protein